MRLEYNGGIGDARVDVLVIAISQHYRLARRLVKEACSSKAKAVSMTDEDAAAGRYLSDVILKYGGKTIGGYCRECFEKATAGLDLRSYKLKFALIRLRDSLKPIPAHRDIARRMDFLVEFAERLAGCVPDEKRRGKSSKPSKNDCGASMGPLFDSQDEREMPVLSVSIPGFDSVMPAARKDSHEAPESKKARKSAKDKSYEKLSSYILSHADKDPDCEGSEDSGESDEDVEECQEDKEEQPDHTEQREQQEQYQQEEEE